MKLADERMDRPSSTLVSALSRLPLIALARSDFGLCYVCGGVFHLWGNSWEIADADRWRRLDAVFGLMAEVGRGASALVIGQVCQRVTVRSGEVLCRFPHPTVSAEEGRR